MKSIKLNNVLYYRSEGAQMFCQIKKNWFLTFLIILFVLIAGLYFWNNKKINANNVPTSERLTGELDGIVVDSRGRIYIGDATNSTLDIYSDKGRYLYNIPVDTRGSYSIEVDDQDNIHIGLVRDEKLLVYDKNGKLVSSKDNTDEYKRMGDEIEEKFGDENKFIDKEGNKYLLKQDSFFYRNNVTKITPSGESTIIVIMPLEAYKFRFFKSCIILIVFEAIFFIVYKIYLKRKSLTRINKQYNKWYML